MANTSISLGLAKLAHKSTTCATRTSDHFDTPNLADLNIGLIYVKSKLKISCSSILTHLIYCHNFVHAKVAIGRRLGIEEPQLMKIIRATLYTHSEWFKLQMCKDRFEGLLRIDALKEVGAKLIIDASRLDVDMSTDGSSQVTGSSNNRKQEDGSPTQSSARDVGCDETAILKVMVSFLFLSGF